MQILIFITGLLLGYLIAEKFKSSKLSAQIKSELSDLSRQSLQENNQNFLNLAENQFKNLQQSAATDLNHQKNNIQNLISNIEKNLSQHQEFVYKVEKQNLNQLAELSSKLQNLMQSEKELSKTTKSLETALRSNQTVGSWGEIQLHRILEMAGLKQYVDFNTQVHLENEDGQKLRPDLLLNLPNDRVIVIDSKTPISNYLKSCDTDNRDLKAQHLKTYVADFKKHIQDLFKKHYQGSVKNSAPFIIMFVPNDALYNVAFENSADLLDFAIAKKVVIATPSTLLAMLLLVEKSWQDQKLSAKLSDHYEHGAKLIERIKTFVGHIQSVGKGLSAANTAFNKIQGSYEKSVLPQMRKFQDLRKVKQVNDLIAIDRVQESNIT